MHEYIQAYRHTEPLGSNNNVVICLMVIQNMLQFGLVGNRRDVEDLLILITGGRSNDMQSTLEEAAKARREGLNIIVVGVSTWINVVELAGVASYPYSSTRILLPDGYGTLPAIRSRLRNMICNSKWTFPLTFQFQFIY